MLDECCAIIGWDTKAECRFTWHRFQFTPPDWFQSLYYCSRVHLYSDHFCTRYNQIQSARQLTGKYKLKLKHYHNLDFTSIISDCQTHTLQVIPMPARDDTLCKIVKNVGLRLKNAR